MSKLVIIAAALLLSTSAFAQVTCNTFSAGPNSFTNCSNGASANTFTAGPNSFTTITPPSAPASAPSPGYQSFGPSSPYFTPLGKTR